MPDQPLDLSRYSRDDLGEHLRGLLEVVPDLWRTARWLIGGLAVLWAVVLLALGVTGEVLLILGALVSVSVVSVELIVSASGWWILRRKLLHAISAADIVGEICEDVLGDLESISAGQAEPPTPAGLIQAVFTTIVLPLVTSLTDRMIPGRMVSWLIRRLSGVFQRKIVGLIPGADVPVSLGEAAIERERERIAAAQAGLARARTSATRTLRHLTRYVLPPVALVALLSGSLQALPLATTTAQIARDARLPNQTGVLSSAAPLQDPITGAAVCAVRIDSRARYGEEERLASAQHLVLAEDARLSLPDGTALSLPGGEVPLATRAPWPGSGTWADGQRWAQGDSDSTPAPLPDLTPVGLTDAGELRMDVDALACGEAVSLHGVVEGGALELQDAPPHPAEHIAGGLLLLWLLHQFGLIPMMVPLAFYLILQLAYIWVYLWKS